MDHRHSSKGHANSLHETMIKSSQSWVTYNFHCNFPKKNGPVWLYKDAEEMANNNP